MDILLSIGSLLTALWVVLSIFSALGYAIVDFTDDWLLKRLAGTDAEESVDAVGTLVIISGLFGVVISVLFGLTSILFGDSQTLTQFAGETYIVTDGYDILRAILAGGMEVVWLIPYLYALKKSGALKVSPLFQLVPIFALFFGFLFFQEIPALLHIIASLIIVSGGILLNLKKKSFDIDGKTLSLMVLASAVISLEFFLFKGSAIDGNFFATVFWSGIGMAGVSAILCAFYKPYQNQFISFITRADKDAIAIQFGNEGLNTISLFSNHVAVIVGPSVMVVSALNAFQPLFILIIGILLAKFGSKSHVEAFKGSEKYKKITAIILIAVGTVLIAL